MYKITCRIKHPDLYYRHDWKNAKVIAWQEKLIRPKPLAVIFDLMYRRMPVVYDCGRIVGIGG